MNHSEAGAFWERNAEAWTQLARAGHDVFRDQVNTPAFFTLLPPVAGLAGLDLGCGEGHHTRLLARQGALMTGLDIAPTFIRHAEAEEARAPLGISYVTASAVHLPFPDRVFDFVTGFMSLHDIPELEVVLREVVRVLRPGGFLQFSILHPCFNPPHRRVVRDEAGDATAIEVSDYFLDADGRVDTWTFGSVPESVRRAYADFQVPRFHRPLAEWMNLLVDAGLVIERCAEPRPSAAAVAERPTLRDGEVAPYFLLVRARRPALRVTPATAPAKA